MYAYVYDYEATADLVFTGAVPVDVTVPMANTHGIKPCTHAQPETIHIWSLHE